MCSTSPSPVPPVRRGPGVVACAFYRDGQRMRVVAVEEIGGHAGHDLRTCWRNWTRRGESQISLTDPDSRAMAAHTHVAVGYNVQIAVDAKHKLIVEQQVTNQVVDMGLLAQTAEPAKEVLGADRGRGRPGLFQDRGHRGL